MISQEKRKYYLLRFIARLQRRVQALTGFSRRLSWIRLMLFLAVSALVVATLLVWSETASAVTLGLGLVVFVSIARVHSRVEKMRSRFQNTLDLSQILLARLSLDWEALPQPPPVEYDATHPFGFDLDIIGPQSLHRLMDAAVSEEGSRKLARWLLDPSPAMDTVDVRRKRVRELIPKNRFRRRLKLLFDGMQGDLLQGGPLRQWLASHVWPMGLKRDLFIAALMTGVNALLFSMNRWGPLPPWWMVTFGIYVLFYMQKSRKLNPLFLQADTLDLELGRYRRLFRYIEEANYAGAPHLKALCEPFLASSRRPSVQLRQVKTASAMAGLRMNPVLCVMLNIAIPWDFFAAWQLNACRLSVAGELPVWLDRFSELEALLSIADFAWMNPEFVFPQIDSDTVLDACDLGHPLIRPQDRVCNDFHVQRSGALFILTGSNMAGKSTFLKTVGINAVLAMAGGPVCARQFSMTPLRIFTCMRISDSLTDGYSYFYAEVRRLKELLSRLEESQARPLLYLIDEIFRGTNNRERLLGSRAYVRRAACLDGIGLIATHDLELAHLADELDSVMNYHFREEVASGEMVFDFRLRTGPCPTTNALKIMAQEGLPVEWGGESRHD